MDELELFELKAELLGSLLLFTRFFYKLRTGREFVLSEPIGRESHYKTICRELVKAFNLQTKNLIINVPPGHGKSELLIHFIAWAMAHYPDSQFLYISYSHELAAKHTYTIKQIISLPMYKKLFGIEIKSDSKAKDNFKTNFGGAVKAFGSSGSITGQDGGLPNLDRFSGAVIMDDMHKPDDVFSDTLRQKVKENYSNTILQRMRGDNVPLIFIGQCLHEDDLALNLRDGFDGRSWENVVLKAVDETGNVLAPNIKSKEELLIMQERRPYVFSAQYQQTPSPAGGAVFKPEWYAILDEEPEILATFITADTAETDKNYNDPTVFSFWGVYKIQEQGITTDLTGLHWLDCLEIWCEPKDLEAEFKQFYSECLCHPVQPKIAAIEKKSTGVTLSSILKNMRGLQIIDIERTRASGNKAARFLEAQPYVASGQISISYNARHKDKVINHCKSITLNDTHKHDDIADTKYDAINLALIKRYFDHQLGHYDRHKKVVSQIMTNHMKLQNLRRRAHGR